MSKRDLLRKLSSIRHAERGIVPDQTWVSRTRSSVVEHVRQDLASGRSFRSVSEARPAFAARLVQWMRAPALVTLSIITTVFGGSLISVSASERSIPGDFLYPIKLAGEQTRLAFTSDKTDRLRLKTEFVDRRVDEIKTIASKPDATSPDRLRQAAQVLKRDLDTVKTQLKEVKRETSAPEAAEVAKLVDQKSEAVAQELKQVKETVPQEVKQSVSEAEVAAVHTGVSAVEVLIDANQSPDGQNIVSDADVAKAIENKVLGIQATLDGAVLAASSTLGSPTASSSASQISAASTTLQEVRALLSEDNLDEVTDKLIEAAQTASQAEIAVDLAASSSSTTSVPPATNQQTTSTSSVPTSSTSTSATSSTSTTPSPP